jgi:phage anti-repressor protein
MIKITLLSLNKNKLKTMLELNEKAIIEKSLTYGTNLKFKDFIAYNNIELDSIFVDKVFHNLDSNMPIYFDKEMIEYFGYSGIMKNQVESVKTLIEQNFSDYENKLWFNYNNKKYIEYRENLESDHIFLYPPVSTGRGKSTTKHLLVMPKIFKEMLMVCQTERGKRIRSYFLQMEEVSMLYFKYQCLVDKLIYKDECKQLFSKEHTRRQAIIEFDNIACNRYRIGCVYYIQNNLTKNIKIGWCWNLPKRLQCLQIANDQELTIIKSELTQFPYDREQYLHNKYKANMIRGEWFTSDIM